MPRLLLVEDDNDLRWLLERALLRAGYDVRSAATGRHGLRLGLNQIFDVMVIDRGLPAMDGLELTAQLRRSGVLTPVLIMSAYGTEADREAGRQAGAQDYLVKPFDLADLLSRLRELRGGSQSYLDRRSRTTADSGSITPARRG